MVTNVQVEKFKEPASLTSGEPVAHRLEFADIRDIKGPIASSYAGIVTLEPSLSDEVLVGFLRDGRLRVVSPIRVKFTSENEHDIAEASELNEFGFGTNPSEALADLQHAIAELYFTLEEEKDSLGPDLQGTWQRLQQMIQKR